MSKVTRIYDQTVFSSTGLVSLRGITVDCVVHGVLFGVAVSSLDFNEDGRKVIREYHISRYDILILSFLLFHRVLQNVVSYKQLSICTYRRYNMFDPNLRE